MTDPSHVQEAGRPCLSVSIVVYDRRRDQKHQQDSILAEAIRHVSASPFCESVVVLDNSPIRQFEWTTHLSDKILYIHFSGSNLGYGRAHNVARFLCSSSYHLFLNPDIVFFDGSTLPKLLALMGECPDLALIQPQIMDPCGTVIQRLCKRDPTLLAQVGRGMFPALYKMILTQYNDWYEMSDVAYASLPVESSYLSGCFMLCRRSCLDQVDWFDPRFFMYLEDADLTRRLSFVGRCVHEPRVRVGHLWGRGSHRSLRLKLVAIASYFRYASKWGCRLV